MRLIDADALMDDICGALNQMTNIGIVVDGEWLWEKLNDALDNAPTIEPQKMRGKWIEKTVAENPKAAGIEEWQSCKCSNCKRYDTRPYLYPFSEPNYCGWCGADMREG